MNTITLLSPVTLPDGRIELSAILTHGFRTIKQHLIVDADGLSSEQLDHSGDVWAILFLYKMMEIGGSFHIKSTLSKSLWRN